MPEDHRLLVGGDWLETGSWDEVRSPYDDRVVGRVALADAALAERAVAVAEDAFRAVAFPQHERAATLERAAGLIAKRSDDLAATITAESGKPIRAASVEVERTVVVTRFSAVEARKLGGEMIPMEASPAGAGKLGMVLRVPFGVVAAISPFNFPLNLVAHKLGPAIAAGNTVVLKPAEQTPISALKLAEILVEAGLPDGWLNVVPGPGPEVGGAIVQHPATQAVTFTGSTRVGLAIRRSVPDKKVNLELGSNAPLIVDADGDWEAAAERAAVHAFSQAGQSCISVQRILLHDGIADAFTDRLLAGVSELRVGDPTDPTTDVGPLITRGERDRVRAWVEEAVAAGGELLAGGGLVDDGRCLAPTLIGAPPKDSKVWRDEVFGPVATIDTFADLSAGIAMANDSRFGLQAGIFTRDLGRALVAARTLEFAGVLVNEVPTFRADQQPYGGIKLSGNTREGPASAVRELTEERFVSLQG